jgi:excisionase family DNA binding protein
VSDAQPEVMLADEAAALLRISVDKLRALSATGAVPSWRVGGQWRYSRAALMARLGRPQVEPAAVNAAKGARSLDDVRKNAERLQGKARGATAETYELIGEYLDLVLPEMRELDAADQLDLQPGLNVIDVAGHSQQLQAMVIRACLERINAHEEGVLTVFPEAWEFAPRGRKTPASDEAIAMARKGAVLGNLLLCDSQDIAGVDTTVRQAASVWILGVQRELNELDRTLKMIPAGIKKPKAKDITSLTIGQFIVCYGDKAIRTYVQPADMDSEMAKLIAKGHVSIDDPGTPWQHAPADYRRDARDRHAEYAASVGNESRQRVTPAAEAQGCSLAPAPRVARSTGAAGARRSAGRRLGRPRHI